MTSPGDDGHTYVGDLFDGAASKPETEDSPEPFSGRRFVLEDEVGRGGLGAVHQAIDTTLGRRVAVKSLHRQSFRSTRRFEREMHLTARLQHPNIIPVYDGGRDPDGIPYLAMRLVEGRTLAEAIASRSTLRARLELLPHLIDACNAIAYAHSQRVVHRDVKPENVLIGGFGETVVIDWGLAKDLDADERTEEVDPGERADQDGANSGWSAPASGSGSASMTREGSVLGTPAYMSPEQASGKPAGPTMDVYALGATIYEVLAGARPYADVGGDAADVLERVVAGAPTPIRRLASNAPPDLVAVVERAMARRPGDRYPSAEELAADLETFAAGRFVAAYRYSPRERLVRSVRRNPGVFALLGAGAVGLTVAFVAITSAYRVAEQERGVAERAMDDAMASRDEARRARDAVALEGARYLAASRPGRAFTLLDGLSEDVPFDGTVRMIAATAWAAGTPDRLDVSGTSRMATRDGVDLIALATDGGLESFDRALNPVRTVPLPDRPLAVVVLPRFTAACLGSHLLLVPHAGGDARRVPLDEPCTMVDYGPGDQLLVAHEDHATLSTADGEPVWTLPITGSSYFHRSGIGFEHTRGGVTVWRDGAVVAEGDRSGSTYKAALAPDGGRFAMAGEKPALVLVDVEGAMTTVPDVQQEWLTPVAWMDDTTLLIGGSEAMVELVDADTARVVQRLALDSRALEMTRVGDGRIALITEQGTLLLASREDQRDARLDVLAIHPGRPEGIFTVFGDRIAVLSEGDVSLYATEPVDRRLVASGLGLIRSVEWFDETAAELVVVSSEGVGTLDRQTGAYVSWTTRPAILAERCEDTWWVGHADGIAAYQVGNGRMHQVVDGTADGEARALLCRPDGRGVWMGTRDPGEVFEVGPDGVERRWTVSRDSSAYDLEWIDGDLHVAADGWWRIDLASEDLEPLGPVRTMTRKIVRLDGRLGVVHREGMLAFEDGTRTSVFTGRVSRVVELEDGLVLLGETGQAAWWTSLDEPPALLDGHVQYLIHAERAPGTGVLATAGWDAQVRLWDLTVDPTESRLLVGHEDAVYALAWSPDGQTLFSGDRQGQVIAWSDPLPTDPDALREVVSTFATAAEEGRSLPSLEP